jgi:membrane fusion protein (multidrug efflux system)
MRRSVLAVFVALALSAVALVWWRQGEPAAAPGGSGSGAPGRGPAGGPPGASAPPLQVPVVEVQPEALKFEVRATGTLAARESVQIVSELNRRLLRVHAEEGTAVKKGQLLFELDIADVTAEMARLGVQIALAKLTLARVEKLVQEGLTSSQERESAQANLDALSAERRILGVTLEKARIRAPFAGQLGLRRVSEGAWVSPNTVLSTLQDTSELRLDFAIPERYASLLRPGSEVSLTVASVPGVLSAKVRAVEPEVDARSRSMLVRAVLEPGPGLLPGAFANVTIPLSEQQALMIPALVVMPGVDGRRVFVVEEGKARSVKVELGERTDERVQVLEGLKPGAQLITGHLLRLREGMPVVVLPAGAR